MKRMHSIERQQLILEYLKQRGFVPFRDLEVSMDASASTIRRDLDQLSHAGLITRIHGGVKLGGPKTKGNRLTETTHSRVLELRFQRNMSRNRRQKVLIGREAARLCSTGEAVVIGGGSTTLQMCPHFAGLNLQVLTNSLDIINALLPRMGARLLVPGGKVDAERGAIVATAGDDCTPQFRAEKLFISGTAIGPVGLMQSDIILIASQRRMIDQAETVVVLVDSSKFEDPSGHVVCGLDQIDIVVTDEGISARHLAMLEAAGTQVIVARE